MFCGLCKVTLICRPADTESRRRLRSASSTSLDVRPTRLSTVGSRTFPVAAARLWNSLPSAVGERERGQQLTAEDGEPASSAVVLNHISFHFLIPLSESYLYGAHTLTHSSFWTLQGAAKKMTQHQKCDNSVRLENFCAKFCVIV